MIEETQTVKPFNRLGKEPEWEFLESMGYSIPSADKSLEYLVDRARRMAIRHAEVSTCRLNPNRKTWEGIVGGLGQQAYTSGWPYCP